MNEMEAARQKQFKDKDVRLAAQAKAERDEFLGIIEKQKHEEAAEKKLDEEKHNALLKHSQCLREQIAKNEEKRKQDRLDYLEEGKKTR